MFLTGESYWQDVCNKAPSWRSHLNYGVALTEQGRDDEALVSYEASLVLDPYGLYTHISLGRLHERSGRHEAALKHYSMAVECETYGSLALVDRGDYYLALFDYEFVARSYSGSEVFVTALQREYEIALLFAGGLKRKLWGLRIVDASDEAEELLIRVQERLPGSRLAENAAMSLADFYFSRRDMALAAEMYEIYIENYPRSERIGKARKRLIYAHLASFKGPEFVGAGLAEAREGLLALKATDPVTAQKIGADALLTRIDESNARKMLVTARWYLKTNDVIAAELTIRRLLRRFPTAMASDEALRLMPTILPRLPRGVLEEAPDYEGLLSPPDESPALDRDPDPGPGTGERER